jgi:hypothetical protein
MALVIDESPPYLGHQSYTRPHQESRHVPRPPSVRRPRRCRGRYPRRDPGVLPQSKLEKRSARVSITCTEVSHEQH